MAQVYVIGRITADLELKTSEKKNPYVRFDIAENIGSRQNLHTQYFQVCAYSMINLSIRLYSFVR